MFSTAKDNQDAIHVRICQGESRKLAENQGLGEIQLTGRGVSSRLMIIDGAEVLANTDNSGLGGNLLIDFDEVVLGSDSTISVGSTGASLGPGQHAGDAGNLTVLAWGVIRIRGSVG